MRGLIIIAVLIFYCSALQFHGRCTQPLHHGIQQCTNKSSIRYHVDTATQTCLAFKYSGCGGNDNNFGSHNECHRSCFPMDYFSCPGGSDVILDETGTGHCGGPMGIECKGKNSYCSTGSFVGKCCDIQARDKVQADYDKQCGPKKVKYQLDMGGYNSTLLGKTCDSNFCPSGTTCHQGNYYAYCCQ